MRLHSARSSDNGATWSVVGPLSDPAWDALRDRNHIIDFNDDLPYLTYTEQGLHSGNTATFWTSDLFKCLQAFNPFVEITPDTTKDEFYTMLSMQPGGIAYMSLIDFAAGNPYETYFRSSTDNGTSWGTDLDITATIGTNGFDMAGMDGPLMFDANGSFIAALAFPVLDDTWAAAHGLLGAVSYPAYTQSTDGGATWSDLELIFGTEGANYPTGHSGVPAFDSTVVYVGGVQDAGYSAFNNAHENVAVTSDGLAHIVTNMNDTTYGYAGLWHTIVDNGVMTTSYIGFPENSALEGESGVAFMPSLAKAADGHVVAGWTEFIQGSGGGAGDICMNAIAAGSSAGTGPINITQDAADETYNRIVDLVVPTANPPEYYCDWLFIYYGDGGNAADSTLWHLQTTYNAPTGIDDDDTQGANLPKAVALSQNYPNPFNPMTTITYALDRDAKVTLEIRNLRGQLIKTLENGVREAGNHTVTWDGRNGSGEIVASGIYFYRLRTDDGFNQTRKMVLLK